MTNFSAAISSNFRPACFYHAHSAVQRAAVVVSACLAGEKVRYDGADKLLPFHALLHSELQLIPICPEMGAGLGVPRPAVQLIEREQQIHALGRENRSLDVTAALQSFAERSLQRLTREHLLCGYLWKSRSPSCGFGSTPLFDTTTMEIGKTDGIQAGLFRRQLPFITHDEDTAIATESAALHFILRCRLVFDVLHASDATLPALHRHYQFLQKRFDERIANNLDELTKRNDRGGYMAELLDGCRQIAEADLLRLFL